MPRKKPTSRAWFHRTFAYLFRVAALGGGWYQSRQEMDPMLAIYVVVGFSIAAALEDLIAVTIQKSGASE